MGADAGAVMRRLVGRKGSGGGHSRYAGGQIPLPEGTDLRKLERVLRKRWQRLVGVADAVPEPLVTLEQQE